MESTPAQVRKCECTYPLFAKRFFEGHGVVQVLARRSRHRKRDGWAATSGCAQMVCTRINQYVRRQGTGKRTSMAHGSSLSAASVSANAVVLVDYLLSVIRLDSTARTHATRCPACVRRRAGEHRNTTARISSSSRTAHTSRGLYTQALSWTACSAMMVSSLLRMCRQVCTRAAMMR